MKAVKSFFSSLYLGEILRARLVLSIAALFAATDFSFSQSYSITPNDTLEMPGYMEDLQTLTISQLNLTNDSIFLKWKKVSANVPVDWEATICDNRGCYTDLADSGFMSPVLPTETGFLLLHITAHVNYGTAIIRYAVWNIATPSNRDTITFIMTVNAPSSIVESKNTFNIFPNPANDNLSISFADNKEHKVEIVNSIGEKIFSENSSVNEKLRTANWLNGIYTISVSENKNSFFTKTIIVQH